MQLGSDEHGNYIDASARSKKHNTYTVYVSFPDGIEEIDVAAPDSFTAKQIAKAALSRDYLKGGKIRKVVERYGLFL